MESENYSDETIDYIYGDMDEQEKEIFEEKLKSDPALANDVKKLKEIIGEIKLGVQLEEILKDPGYEWADREAEKAVNDYIKRQRGGVLLSKTFWRKNFVAIAASFLFLLYLGNLTIFLVSPELAFEKYYKDYSPVYYAQATIDEAQVLLTHSLDEYSKGNYEGVTDNMRDLMKKGELNFRGQVMLAFYDVWSKPLFYNFKTQETTEEDATWYLALAAYKLNDLQKAQELFSKISSEKSLRGWRAARMERKINKMLLAE
jgi:hypothetical protein